MQADQINPSRCSLIGLIQAGPHFYACLLAAYTIKYNEKFYDFMLYLHNIITAASVANNKEKEWLP